jgi:Transposase family tnp2
MENLVPVSMIPGPKSPKSVDSFMIPLIDQCIALAQGIRTYNTLTKQNFMLHAYLLTFSRDLPAMSKVLCLKGHNSFCPCRYCLITSTTYYPVLTPPHIPGQVRNKWDPHNLPLWTHQVHIWHLTEINQIIGQQCQDDQSIQYGMH